MQRVRLPVSLMVLLFLYILFLMKKRPCKLLNRVISLGLLCSLLVLANNVFIMYITSVNSLRLFSVGLFLTDFYFRCLIGQFIIIVSLLHLINSAITNKYANTTCMFTWLCIKLLLKSIDFSLFVPCLYSIGIFFGYAHDITFKILPSKEASVLNDDMHKTLRQLINMKGNLEKFKRENGDVDFVIDKEGGLQIEVDTNNKLSDNEISALTQRVQIADIAYNTQLEKYRQLEAKDVRENEGLFSSNFKKSAGSITEGYNKLFVHEK